MSTSDDNLFSRWSQRKAEVAKEEAAGVTAVPVEEPVADLEGLSDEEVLAKLELPDPDTLKEGDDFTGFMSSAVPDHLRKRALRVLWKSNPTLANLDGLIDYGDDFTDAAMVPEVLNTAYKVGRGFLKDIIEDDDEADAVAEGEEADEVEPEIEMAELEEQEEVAEAPLPQMESEPHVPRPRLRFTKA